MMNIKQETYIYQTVLSRKSRQHVSSKIDNHLQDCTVPELKNHNLNTPKWITSYFMSN
jgi:hypothetical protein